MSGSSTPRVREWIATVHGRSSCEDSTGLRKDRGTLIAIAGIIFLPDTRNLEPWIDIRSSIGWVTSSPDCTNGAIEEPQSDARVRICRLLVGGGAAALFLMSSSEVGGLL